MKKKKERDWDAIKCNLVLLALAILFLVTAFSVSSCRSHKEIVPTIVEKVVTDVRTETVYVHDTIKVELPAQSSERLTRDSTSHLETDYAVSVAKILSDGSLFHALKNKARKLSVPFLKPIERKDSIVYRDKLVREPYEVRVPVEVVKPLTWWQQTQIRGFWGLLVVVALFVGVRYRHPLIAILKRVV